MGAAHFHLLGWGQGITIYLDFKGDAIINTIDNSIVEEIELGTRLARMALDAPANRLYVTDRRGDRVLVVDTEARVVLGQVVVGSDPVDIAIVPERKR